MLLPDMPRVLGPDHPDTLKTRSNIAFWRTVKAIGDDQLERLQSEQRAEDHLVETGQQQERLPQATAAVVPDRGDDDPTHQRHHHNGFQAHGPGLYAVPSTTS